MRARGPWPPRSALALAGGRVDAQGGGGARGGRSPRTCSTGVIDLHHHQEPDERPRNMDIIDASLYARLRGMRGAVFKSHSNQTATTTWLAAKMVPNFLPIPVIDLNLVHGGLNKYAVDNFATIIQKPAEPGARHRHRDAAVRHVVLPAAGGEVERGLRADFEGRQAPAGNDRDHRPGQEARVRAGQRPRVARRLRAARARSAAAGRAVHGDARQSQHHAADARCGARAGGREAGRLSRVREPVAAAGQPDAGACATRGPRI